MRSPYGTRIATYGNITAPLLVNLFSREAPPVGRSFLSLALTALPAAAEEDAVVHISMKAPGYTAANAPAFARVKFNKAAPLYMISDDMSLGNYCSAWALFNGYPHAATTHDRKYARGDLLLDEAVRGLPSGFYDGDADLDGAADGVHEPLTFSDGAGGGRRFPNRATLSRGFTGSAARCAGVTQTD